MSDILIFVESLSVANIYKLLPSHPTMFSILIIINLFIISSHLATEASAHVIKIMQIELLYCTKK